MSGDESRPQSDQSPILSTLRTDRAVFREIVEEFIEFMTEKAAEIRQAHAAKDFERLAELAHAVKGSGGTAGFDALTEPAKELQQLAQDRQYESMAQEVRTLSELAERIAAGSVA